MRELRMIVVPSTTRTLLWAKDATDTTTLRANLPALPWRARAVPMLLEAIGSFVALRAALVVPAKQPSCATRLYPGWFADFGGDNYDLQVIGSSRRELRDWWRR